ncbi:VOC family protein [Egibacter rhizosphaerae]|uniref:VOC family protein n=1 Tax=Egibacter rhizosphaerae TaxID=1670831 RepID=A0A411YC63_9ACTN|nr:VOC family protein [Egibacter rhizosphaerae]QBI18843.1 VOC family protein [Egibacter rhizosphaerae]
MDVVSVRYIVDDVEQAIAFYRDHLGFDVDLHPAPGFARLHKDRLRLLLNAPGAGGAGRAGGGDDGPRPGGWNRFQLTVEDLDGLVATLRAAGVTFRSDVVSGMGGRQALVADPAGNVVELFEPHQD